MINMLPPPADESQILTRFEMLKKEINLRRHVLQAKQKHSVKIHFGMNLVLIYTKTVTKVTFTRTFSARNSCTFDWA